MNTLHKKEKSYKIIYTSIINLSNFYLNWYYINIIYLKLFSTDILLLLYCGNGALVNCPISPFFGQIIFCGCMWVYLLSVIGQKKLYPNLMIISFIDNISSILEKLNIVGRHGSSTIRIRSSLSQLDSSSRLDTLLIMFWLWQVLCVCLLSPWSFVNLDYECLWRVACEHYLIIPVGINLWPSRQSFYCNLNAKLGVQWCIFYGETQWNMFSIEETWQFLCGSY